MFQPSPADSLLLVRLKPQVGGAVQPGIPTHRALEVPVVVGPSQQAVQATRHQRHRRKVRTEVKGNVLVGRRMPQAVVVAQAVPARASRLPISRAPEEWARHQASQDPASLMEAEVAVESTETTPVKLLSRALVVSEVEGQETVSKPHRVQPRRRPVRALGVTAPMDLEVEAVDPGGHALTTPRQQSVRQVAMVVTVLSLSATRTIRVRRRLCPAKQQHRIR